MSKQLIDSTPRWRFWYGHRLNYSLDLIRVRLTNSFWWVGALILGFAITLLFGCLGWNSSWQRALQILVSIFLGGLGLVLLSWEEWTLDRIRRQWASTLWWLGIPVQRNSGTFSDIECLRFAERIFEESNTFHLYLRAVTSHFKPALFFTQDWIPH